jgi:hypothetical protein
LSEQDKARKAFLEDNKLPEVIEEDKNKTIKEKFKKEYLAALKKEGLFILKFKKICYQHLS